MRNVILKTPEDELSQLKCLTDYKGDIHSIHKLVYQDIKDPAVREEASGLTETLPSIPPMSGDLCRLSGGSSPMESVLRDW